MTETNNMIQVTEANAVSAGVPFILQYILCQALTSPRELPDYPETFTEVSLLLKGLKELGLLRESSREDGTQKPEELPTRLQKSSHRILLSCGSYNSVLALLLPIAAALGKNCQFEMDESLMDVSMNQVLRTLKVHGIRHEIISRRSMRIWGKLTAGTYLLSAQVEERFLTGLLFALSLLPEKSILMVDGIIQDSYEIKRTLTLLEDAGIRIEARIEEEEPSLLQHLRARGSFIGASFRIPSALTRSSS